MFMHNNAVSIYAMDASESFDSTASFQSEENHYTSAVVPLVIQQINEYAGNTLKLWGIEVNVASIIGIVRSVVLTADSKLMYTVDDHTGSIRCFHWICPGIETEQSKVAVGSYAHIYGTIRKLQDERSIMIHRIVPCRSFNEVTTHLLEVLQTRYRAEQIHAEQCNLVRMSVIMPHVQGQPEHWNEIEKRIYAEIKGCQFKEGISLQLLQHLIPSVHSRELLQITDSMCREGFIFTTIDAYHFHSVD